MSVWSGEYVSAVSAFSLRMTRLSERGFSVTHERLAIGKNGPNEENLAIDVTFQIGYRAITVELDDLDDIYADLEFKGFFAGLEVHF